MVCDENLSKFLANKNLNTLYMDFLGQKILILNSYSSKTKKANFSVFGKENILLKGNLIKNFFKKSFILKQKINKNLKNLSLLDEALNLLAGISPHKKSFKAYYLCCRGYIKKQQRNYR